MRGDTSLCDFASSDVSMGGRSLLKEIVAIQSCSFTFATVIISLNCHEAANIAYLQRRSR